MQRTGKSSWMISVDRWNQFYDCALWIRAAECIDVAADPTVPGPLDFDLGAAASVATNGELAEQWLLWWKALLNLPAPRAEIPTELPEMAYSPPDFPGLAQWPVLRERVLRRWSEAYDWHSDRKYAELRRHAVPSPHEGAVVRQVEESLGRAVRPFNVQFVLLPVADDTVRQANEARYLVPERVYDGPGWPDWLRGLVERIG